MNRFFGMLALVFVSLFTLVEVAEAARFGGGRSSGMQRGSSSSISRQATPPAQTVPQKSVSPTSPATQPAAAQPQPKRSWLGPIAGLAAGIGLAALMSHLGLGEGFANILMLVLLAIAAVFVFRLLFRRAAPSQQTPQLANAGAMRQAEPYAAGNNDSAGRAPMQTPTASASSAGGADAASFTAPAGFDTDAFLRVAKANFIRMQTANDAGNLTDIREFTSPEMFAEISLQITERNKAPQQTDVVTLNAELIDLASEGERHIASVRFSGMIREQSEGGANPFDEIWHLSKPVDGSQGWVVAGIQQIS